MTGTPSVPEDRSAAEPSRAPSREPSRAPAGGSTVSELAALRTLLLREDRARLDDIEARLAAMDITAEELAERLPEAIALRARQDKQLGVALAATVEDAIEESVRRRPGDFADAIFPVLGPAIRKAIAETMAELVASINRAMEHSFSPRGIRWRVEAWRSGVPYAQVVMRHALVYRVEQVFLVHSASGLLIAKASPPDLVVPDADLVSGMLTAIRDFVGDSFAQDAAAGGLRTFRVGELTVLVEPGPDAMLAAVVRGEAPESFRVKLQETIEGVHAQFSSALAEFDGDSAPFDGVQPMLDDRLDTVLETDTPKGAKVNWRPVAIAVVLLIVLAITIAVRADRRWDRVTAALDSTPGLTVVRAERGWWRSAIRGLRDPDAPTPDAVIVAAGSDPALIKQRWDPYLSLAPEMVAARTAREAATSGATSGAMPAAMPAALRPLADSIAAARILFAIGSAALGAEGSASLARVAERLGEMRARADALHGVIDVELIGRADGSGTDANNASLSAQRVDAVLAALAPAARGARVITRAVGSAAPLDGRDPATRARINRSVSFVVRFVPSPPARSRPE